jgi:hypothetical protein
MSNNPNLTPEQRRALAESVGAAVAGSLESVFGGASAPAATPATAVPGIHLRYGTIRKFVPQTDFNGYTVEALFDRNATDLSLGEGDVTYRESGGNVCGEDTYPVVGKEYIASVNRETKGF